MVEQYPENTDTSPDNNAMPCHDWDELSTNISLILQPLADSIPHRRAVVEPNRKYFRDSEWRILTFRELNRESDRLAAGLNKAGIRKGTRTVLMIKPGIDFVVMTYALFKTGATIILIDPGMGFKNLGKCLKQVKPEAFVGITLAHIARKVMGWSKDTVKTLVTAGPRLFWGGTTLKSMKLTPWESYPVQKLGPDEKAAILFTSGSTGVAKGAVYTHRIFANQVKFLHESWPFNPDDTDLATFPLFALFDPALGITAVIPDMDTAKPAKADPAKLVHAIQEHSCNQMFCSPALLNNLARYLDKKNIMLDGMERVLSSGAPARPDVLKILSSHLPENAEIFTPYGATESLPVSNISSREILEETWKITEKGGGTCIGKPVNGIDVAIIQITDAPIESWNDDLLVPEGAPGEIAVTGPVVTREYYELPHQTKLSKIKLPGGHGVLHRMGDIGRIDHLGRLWFYGRKNHRVKTSQGPMFTVPCEAIFNAHPDVFRSALVGFGDDMSQKPVIIVELEKHCNNKNFKAIENQLKEMADCHPHTSSIKTFLLHPSFPVDVRHNAKINREALKIWAEEELNHLKDKLADR